MTPHDELSRWRLILGHHAEQALNSPALTAEQSLMDEALASIYDNTGGGSQGGLGAGKGGSSPRLAKWLADVRECFQEDLVTVIQQDAIDRKGLRELLYEPEMLRAVQPNLALVGTLLSLGRRIPEKTKDIAREVVRKVVDDLVRRLESGLRQAVTGALNRRAHSPIPSAAAIDWPVTIRRNLKNYQPLLGSIVPERMFFFSRQRPQRKWHVFVTLDQSGSMADSVIHGAVAGSIFASLPALKTRVVAFDTEVVDLTEACGDDPVDMLFGVQLGGGTDINKAVAYTQNFISDPRQTLYLLVTDLCEGGNAAELLLRLEAMKNDGVKVLVLLALSDAGRPYYDEQMTRKVAALGIPCFACPPERLPQLVEAALANRDLEEVSRRIAEERKAKNGTLSAGSIR